MYATFPRRLGTINFTVSLLHVFIKCWQNYTTICWYDDVTMSWDDRHSTIVIVLDVYNISYCIYLVSFLPKSLSVDDDLNYSELERIYLIKARQRKHYCLENASLRVSLELQLKMSIFLLMIFLQVDVILVVHKHIS